MLIDGDHLDGDAGSDDYDNYNGDEDDDANMGKPIMLMMIMRKKFYQM